MKFNSQGLRWKKKSLGKGKKVEKFCYDENSSSEQKITRFLQRLQWKVLMMLNSNVLVFTQTCEKNENHQVSIEMEFAGCSHD